MANGNGAHGRASAGRSGNSQQGYGRMAAQAPSRGGYRPLTSEAGQYSHYNNRYQGRKKKKHTARNVFLTLLVIVVIVGAAGGYTGWTLYNSAKQVRSDASVVMSDISDLKDQILGEQDEAANATARDIAKRAANMKEETSGWEWSVARFIPEYGSDVEMVRELADVFDNLAQNAIVPLVGEVSQVSIKNMIDDGSVNVELAQRLVNALDSAAPVITQSAEAIENMGEAHLEQVARPLEKAKVQIGRLDSLTRFVQGIAPTFSQMLGADGRPRTYLIVAQNNSEIRSTGGFLGSVGPLYLDNGRIELGDFRTIYDIYPADGNGAPLTDEELAIFGRHVGWQIADSNFIPDFARVGEIVKYAWELKGYGEVDGVIGADPVLLQDMLALSGPVTTSSGTVVDGSNAARLLLHDAYYLPPEVQDPFFEEVAALSFKQLMTHLGDVSLTQLMDVVNNDIDTRRLQIWMADENEEEAIAMLGCDGRLSHDEENPVLGVFFTDESYSKLFWYLKADTAVGEGAQNADGSTTYPVTVTYWNMISDVGELSDYMVAHNVVARSDGEMIAWLMLSAPAGGSISGIEHIAGEFMPEGTVYRSAGNDGSYVSGTMSQTTLQGLDFWYGLTRTLPGGTFSISFDVTTSPNATEPLKVVRTPNAQEVAGW